MPDKENPFCSAEEEDKKRDFHTDVKMKTYKNPFRIPIK
jgi:hypothetical protein